MKATPLQIAFFDLLPTCQPRPTRSITKFSVTIRAKYAKFYTMTSIGVSVMKKKIVIAWGIGAVLLIFVSAVLSFGEFTDSAGVTRPITFGEWFTMSFICAALICIVVGAYTKMTISWGKRHVRRKTEMPYINYHHDKGKNLYDIAVRIAFDSGYVNITKLQRELKIGYTQAESIVGLMEANGLIEPYNGRLDRKIILQRDTPTTEVPTLKQDFSQYGGIEAELLTVDLMDGHDFEYYCAEILRNNGFINVTVTQGSGDQGVDVLAEKGGIKYAIQCKCYKSDLGNKPVQEITTGKAIYHCHIGVVLTNRYFTAGAKEAAEATNVLLWDRDKLIELIKKAKNL